MKYGITICGGFLALAMILPVTGCTGDGTPTLLPNADPALRRTSTELAADSAKRAYPATAPKDTKAIARADYNLMSRKINLANLSDSDWKNVEVWINQEYVLNVPMFPKNSGESLNFELFYDQYGHHFQTYNGKNPVQSVQIYNGGKLYDVVATLE
jgi:hypothetical protein